jgi:uncharacterized protein (TIGR02611 family)
MESRGNGNTGPRQEIGVFTRVLDRMADMFIGSTRALEFQAPQFARAASKWVEWAKAMLIKSLQQAKRFLKILFGFTLLALGVIMIVTPGPGWLTILLGLGVLAAEFVWARRLLDRLKEQGGRIRDTVFPRTDRAA